MTTSASRRRSSVVLGLACVVVGALLLAEPFRSLAVLRWLVGLGLAVSAVAELSDPTPPRPQLGRAIGLVWALAAIAAVGWPGLDTNGLGAIVGVSLIIGGGLKVASTLGAGNDAPATVDEPAVSRAILGPSGLTNVIVGVLVLAWPTVTVLVIAVLAGLRTIAFGIGHVIKTDTGVAAEARPKRYALRMVASVLALLLALGGAAISVAVNRAQPNEPGAFYLAPTPLPPGPPGTLIRSEVMPDFYAHATTYRVLYISTGLKGQRTAVSGYIVVPDGPAPPGGRHVLAYTHGTVGVSPRCAPSLLAPGADPLAFEGGNRFVNDGYVIAATDYQGLGTPGIHPYLVGSVEGMNALDSVRAARHLPAAHAATDFAVWGHSQGGHASLFTGQLAGSYAPELRLVGVAAGGPVPDLVALFKANVKAQVGKILIAMALTAWAATYDDANLDQVVTPAARSIAERIGRNCIYNAGQIATSVPGALALNLTFLSAPPWETEPWRTIVATNNPATTSFGAPILLAQGTADPIVLPATTIDLARRLCDGGETVKLQLVEGEGHLELGHRVSDDVADWIGDRFAGTLAPSTCAP